MECPLCKLENPPDAIRCDCGYDFSNGTFSESKASNGVLTTYSRRIHSKEYLNRIRNATCYRTLRVYLQATAILLIFGLLLADFRLASALIDAKINKALVAILAITIAIIGPFVIFAAFQSTILFIDIADTLIDIGRSKESASFSFSVDK
jgi:hypothetical protein